MTGDELRALLEQRRAMLDGHFVLSSGLHSDRFIQKFRIFEDPPTAEAVGQALAALLRPSRPEIVVSAAVGGIILGYVIAKSLGVRNVFVEKVDGKPALRRGFTLAPRTRVAVVEDVMTTGKSVGEVIDVVRAAGADVVALGAVVKRGAVDLPLPVLALLDLPLADYPADECPQCQAGVPLADPGSRRTS